MEDIITVRDLKKNFLNHKALSGISFTVPGGSVYGFLGPNGAGKTTTIKIILGLVSATAGEVQVLGEKVRFGGNPALLRRVGYLPQDPVFPEGLTGREALALVGAIYKIPRQTASGRIEQLLRDFQLDDAANRKVEAYSRGMKQRLGVAAVLVTEPDILILDEPVSALDPEGRRKVLELINELKGRATVFFSSHILADVERVCDRVTIIDKGQKLMEAETKEILAEYAMEQYLVSIIPADLERARNLLLGHPAVREVGQVENGLSVTSHPGKATELAETVLPLLVKENVVVTEFMRRRVDLEEVFFKVLAQNGRNGGVKG